MRDATLTTSLVVSRILRGVALGSSALVFACGGTVVFEGDGGNGDAIASSAASTPNAGTAGPGGVGGADVGPISLPSSAGVGLGSGCRYFAGSAEYCYSNEDCDGPVREAECELTAPSRCWCFQDGVYLGMCEDTSNRCDHPNLCCLEAFPP